MKKKIHYLDEIERYFTVLHDTESLSREEIINLLHAYLKYIFDLNNIDPSEADITIYFVKNISQVDTRDIQSKKDKYIASKLATKEKTYSHKEIIKQNKKDKNNALMVYDNFYVQKYDIYLRDQLMKIKCINDCYSLIDLMIDFGHEVQHVIQHIVATGKVRNINSRMARANNILYDALKNGNKEQQKMVVRIYEKLTKYYGYLATDEIYADVNSHCYLRQLLQDLEDNTDNDSLQLFFSLLDTEVENLQNDDKLYKARMKFEFNKFANEIPNNPFIKKEDLIIP